MRVAALFSGGKDSNYAVFWALHQGWDVPYLITVFSENRYSYMFQTAGVNITELSAKAIGIEHIKVFTSGEKEKELYPLENILKKLDIDGIVSGAVKSEYQRRRLDQICHNACIKSFAPLWHKNPVKMIVEMIDEGWDIRVSGIFSEGLKPNFLGKKFDNNMYRYLINLKKKYKINIDGEGGEFETIVTYGPIYRKKIEIIDYDILWDGMSGYLIVKHAELCDPNK